MKQRVALAVVAALLAVPIVWVGLSFAQTEGESPAPPADSSSSSTVAAPPAAEASDEDTTGTGTGLIWWNGRTRHSTLVPVRIAVDDDFLYYLHVSGNSWKVAPLRDIVEVSYNITDTGTGTIHFYDDISPYFNFVTVYSVTDLDEFVAVFLEAWRDET